MPCSRTNGGRQSGREEDEEKEEGEEEDCDGDGDDGAEEGVLVSVAGRRNRFVDVASHPRPTVHSSLSVSLVSADANLDGDGEAQVKDSEDSRGRCGMAYWPYPFFIVDIIAPSA